jgi:hypothetical protein
MTKPISTRVHGIIDYTWAAAASSSAGRLDGATSTARLLRGAANAATASALVTNYECGAVRLLPMKGHLALDAALCSVLVASPLFLPARERRYAVIPVLLGITGLIVGMLTDTRSPMESEEEFGGLYGGGERSVVDLDPESAVPPGLLRHVE